jgi:hypothetical protein
MRGQCVLQLHNSLYKLQKEVQSEDASGHRVKPHSSQLLS